MSPEFSDRLKAAIASIRQQTGFVAEIAMTTGTGLAGLLAEIEVEARISYSEIEGFPVSTAPSHKGELVFGSLKGRNVVAQNGRFHLYEGWSGEDIILPVYVMRALGAEKYVVTNAAGALNPDYQVRDVMLIDDHINFQGAHPLSGPNDDALGLRFPDMSRAYDPDLSQAATRAAKQLKLPIRNGIYAAIHGPEFETSAERRFLRMAGGDAVGMSTVLEVIAANHAGMKVLGFSAISNSATGGPDQQPDTLEEVLENTAFSAASISKIIVKMLDDGEL